MALFDLCPDCGLERVGGLCPRCLIGLGLNGPEKGLSQPSMAGVLETLSQSIGPMPRVLLRDTENFNGPGPIVRPGSSEMPDLAERAGRLQLFGEIARGGMGAVLKGRDNDLGRDLAVKVLLERHGNDPALLKRFVEEAQIAGQLQHPGVVPVYELGAFADQRPYFAMKLVKGRTLAEVMDERADPSADHPRLLSIFLDIAQTMAYAHARGVIHRDLKPSNVMVGSFGEVQVMDWGLAKVLARGGVVDDHSAGKLDIHETVIATARSGSDPGSDLSHAGVGPGHAVVHGTGAGPGRERPPRRASRRVCAGLDPLRNPHRPAGVRGSEFGRDPPAGRAWRAGGSLEPAGILRGRRRAGRPGPRHPGPRGRRPSDSRRGDCRPALQPSGRSPGEGPGGRTGSGCGPGAGDRGASPPQAASGPGRVDLGPGSRGAGWAEPRTCNSVKAGSPRPTGSWARPRPSWRGPTSSPDEVPRWREASAAAARVDAGHLGEAFALVRLEKIKAEAEAGLLDAERDAELRQALVEVRIARLDAGWDQTDEAYRRAFRDGGLDFDSLSVAELVARLKKRPPAVMVEIVAFLDHWLLVSRTAGKPQAEREKMKAVAIAADDDPFRNQLRSIIYAKDRTGRDAKLKALADDPRSGVLSGPTALLLAISFSKNDDQIAQFRKAVVRHPTMSGSTSTWHPGWTRGNRPHETR